MVEDDNARTCIVDGSTCRATSFNYNVIRYANITHGFALFNEDVAAYAAAEKDDAELVSDLDADTCEYLQDLADDAVTYMNDCLTDSYYYVDESCLWSEPVVN